MGQDKLAGDPTRHRREGIFGKKDKYLCNHDDDDHDDGFTSTKVTQQAEEATDKKIPRNLQLCNRTGPGTSCLLGDDMNEISGAPGKTSNDMRNLWGKRTV